MSTQDIGEAWENVTVDQIAEVLFQVSGGDKRVLNTSDTTYRNDECVWGKSIDKLFKNAINTSRDRLIIFRFWSQNRKGVRVSEWNIF